MLEAQERQYWRLPLIAALVFLVVAGAFQIDISLLLYLFGGVPVLLAVTGFLGHRAYKDRSRRPQIIWTLCALWIVSICFVTEDLTHPSRLHLSMRWLFRGPHYQSEVLAQPPSQGKDLKHVEWDGWGIAGQETVVYLVFDPSDELSIAARSGGPGKFRGIPCEVPLVRRMEKNWYSVTFYTEEDWDHCGSNRP